MGWFSDNFPTVARLFGGGGGRDTARQRRPSRAERDREARRARQVEAQVDASGEAQIEAEAIGQPGATSVIGASEPVTTRGTPPVTSPVISTPPVEPPDRLLAETEAPPSPATLISGPRASANAEPTPLGPRAGQPAGPPDHPVAPMPTTPSQTTVSSLAQMYNTWVELDETISLAQSELQELLANRKNSESLRSQAHEILGQADAAWQEAQLLSEAAWRAFGKGFTADLPGFESRLRMIREVGEARKAQAHLHRETNIDAWEEADRSRQKATADLLKALTAVASAASQVSRELREAGSLPVAAEALRRSALDDLSCAQAVGEELALLGQEALSQLGSSRIAEEAHQAEMAPTDSVTSRLGYPPAQPAPNPGDASVGESTVSAPQERPEPGPGPSEQPFARSPVTAPQAPASPIIEEDQPGEPPISAAEQLRREMAAVTGNATPVVPTPPTGAEVLQPDATGESDASPGETIGVSLNNAPGSATVQESDAPLPESLSGRVYLMFPATLDQNEIESVWEALDEVAGSSAIVDNRLVSREDGIQFTLELGSKSLSINSLRTKMPGAALSVISGDRLKVGWPRSG